MRKVGDKAICYGEVVTIVEKHKGAKVNKLMTDKAEAYYRIKSKPCTYTLSNGRRVRGDKLKPYYEN